MILSLKEILISNKRNQILIIRSIKQLTLSSKNRNNFKIETYKVLQIYIIRIYIIYKIIKDFYVVKTKTKE